MGSGNDAEAVEDERSYWGGDDGRAEPDLSPREIGWYGDIQRSVTRTWDSDGTLRFRVSDKKGQRIVRACLLCKQVRPLRLSHVHPAWTGEAHRMEGGKGGGFVMGYRQKTGEAMHAVQDFARHYLLCHACEGFLGQSEEYVRHLSRGQESDLRAMGATRDQDNLVTGLDGSLVLRFLASFLLRSHAAASAPHIRLPCALVNELRTSIVQNQYAPSRHQLAIAKIYNRMPGANPRASVVRYVPEGQPNFRFEAVLGGLYFIYFLRSPEGRDAKWEQDEFRQLTEYASVELTRVRMLPVEIHDLNIFKIDRGVSMDVDFRPHLPRLDVEAGCPCGWGVGTLRDCCGSTWLREVVEDEPAEV